MTSEQDQVFGANPKIGLRKKECLCRALTWHILSQDFKQVSLRLQPLDPIVWSVSEYPRGYKNRGMRGDQA